MSNDNLGIGRINSFYIETNSKQDVREEFEKIIYFLTKYANYYVSKNKINLDDISLQFINYGKTELVYVLTEKSTGKRVTILTKQPAIEFGKVKQEYDNLIELKKFDKNVVAPIDYFCDEEEELYVTPYIMQARCIASDSKWGMYIPEPFYRFENFTDEQEHIVNTCMIAKLVSLYDFEAKKGIGSCKLGGGDFMLPKGWENETPTIENTLNNLHLIAAREHIKCSFDEYLNILSDEFSKRTIEDNQNELYINLRGRVAMKQEDIKNGIILGKSLIENKKAKKHKNKI